MGALATAAEDGDLVWRLVALAREDGHVGATFADECRGAWLLVA